MNYENFNQIQAQYLSKIEEWMNLCGLKGESIKFSIYGCLVLRNQITLTDLDILISHVTDNVFTFLEGNVIENLIKQIPSLDKTLVSKIFYNLSNETPSSLNQSPNACCGKWELLYRLLRPQSISPTKGDIHDSNIRMEFKGIKTRLINKDVLGKDYHKSINEVMEREEYTANKLFRKNKYGFEPEKILYQGHYKPQFDSNILRAKRVHIDIFNCMGLPITSEEIDMIFEDNQWNYHTFRKLIVIKLGEKMWLNGEFDELWLFGNGSNLKIISSISELKKRIIDGDIQIREDYFRILQSTPIGWYIE